MTCHIFNIADAEQYGVDAAIIIHNLRFWLNHNKANGTNIHDGYYWTYNSARAMSDLFPYWSSNKIQKLMKKLESEGVIIVGNYNKINYDKTKWYTMPEYSLKSLQLNGLTPSANRLNGLSQTAEPIPDVNTHVTTNKNTEHFSKEKRIDVNSLEGYEYCKEAYRFLKLCKPKADNLYTGPLTIEQWDQCEEKLSEVLSEPEEVDTLIFNIHRERNMHALKSVSLPYILMAFTDCEEFAHIAMNCTEWLEE